MHFNDHSNRMGLESDWCLIFHFSLFIFHLNSYPSLLLIAFHNSFADQQLAQTIGEGGVGRIGRLFAFSNGLVYFFEQLFGGIWETFVVAAGKGNHTSGLTVEQGGVAHQLAVEAIAVANPEVVWRFGAPVEGGD